MTEEWPCLLSLIKNYLRLLDMNDLESLSPGQMGAVNYTKAGSFMYLSSIYFWSFLLAFVRVYDACNKLPIILRQPTL